MTERDAHEHCIKKFLILFLLEKIMQAAEKLHWKKCKNKYLVVKGQTGVVTRSLIMTLIMTKWNTEDR